MAKHKNALFCIIAVLLVSLFSPLLSLPASAAEGNQYRSQALCGKFDSNGALEGIELQGEAGSRGSQTVIEFNTSSGRIFNIGKDKYIQLESDGHTLRKLNISIGTDWETLTEMIKNAFDGETLSLTIEKKELYIPYKISFEENDACIVAVATEQESTSEDTATVTDKKNTNSKSEAGDCSKLSALSWIVCSLVNDLSEISSGLYEKFIQRNLVVRVSLLEDDTTSEAWSSFRNIANVLLVIVILVVITSQVTGFGIDNYGIKRLLPKIILSAILINLSLFICRLGIDLSNIFGSGIQSFFDGIGAGEGTGGGWAVAISTLVAAAGVAGVAAGWIEVGIILFGLISAVVGVLTMFLLLAVRQAGVIILTVLAPVAFILNILPNTKSWFSKWLDAFKALLLLYPTCSLVIAAGGLASRIIIGSSDDAFLAVTAVIIAIAPVFFIPKLVRGAFRGLGDIGNKISNFTGKQGARLGQSAQKRMGNSALQSSINERRQQRAANRTHNALDRVAQRQMGKNYDDLTQDEKKKLQSSNFINRGRIARNAAANSEAAKSSNMLSEQAKLASGAYLAGMMARSDAGNDDDAKNTAEWARDIKSFSGASIDEYEYGGETYHVDKAGNYTVARTGAAVSADTKKKIDEGMKTGATTRRSTMYKYDKNAKSYTDSTGTRTMSETDMNNLVSKGRASYDTYKFVKNNSGDWISADGKTNATLADDRMKSLTDSGFMTTTSYAEAKRVESDANRYASLGSTASYAGMNDAQAETLATSKLRSGTTSGEISIDHTNTQGTSGALRVARNEARSADNNTIGRVRASAKMEAQGISPVQSVQSAEQSAQSQLINIATQNAAAPGTVLTSDQIRQAVDTGATRLSNQFRDTVEVNRLGVTETTFDIAHNRAVANRIATERKAWSDQYATAKSGDLETELRAALEADRTATANNDESGHIAAAAKFSAAFQKLATTGNLPILHSVLESEDATSGLSDIMWTQLNQDMISSSDTMFKQFAKQSFAAQGKGATSSPDFYRYVTGQNQNLVDAAGNPVSIKEMADTMNENFHSLDGQDKDTIEALTNNMARRDDSGNYIYQGRPPVHVKHLVSFATSTNKGDELARIDDAIKTFGELFKTTDASGNRVLEPAAQQNLITRFSGAINGSALSKMSSDVVESIAVAVGAGQYDPATKKTTITDPNILQQVFGSAIKDVQNSEQLFAGTSNSVRTLLGMTSSSAGSNS